MMPKPTVAPIPAWASEALSPAGGVAAADDVRRARACIAELTGRLEAPRARALRAELNDAYLRVQFAVVTRHPARLRSEVRTLAQLVRQAQESQRA